MKNSLPFISVIMNCYNCEKYLSQAIDSVLNQTYKHWEIIFWDNLSSDLSAHIVNSYSDTRIKYFLAEKHVPLGEARNLAVEKASGDWVAFLDCDDMWFEDKLEYQVSVMSHGVGLIYSRVQLLYETENQIKKENGDFNKLIYPSVKNLPSGEILQDLFVECFIPLPSVMVLRSLYLAVGGVDKSLKVAEDYDLFLKICAVSKAIALDKALCQYRIHNSSLSSRNRGITFDESIQLVERYLPSIDAQRALIKWRVQYAKQCFVSKQYTKVFALIKQIGFAGIPWMVYFVVKSI